VLDFLFPECGLRSSAEFSSELGAHRFILKHCHSREGGNPSPDRYVLTIGFMKPIVQAMDSRLRGNDDGM
jgi:hypothetical protein